MIDCLRNIPVATRWHRETAGERAAEGQPDPVCVAVDLANDVPGTPDELARRCVDAGLAPEWTAGASDLERVRELLVGWTAVVDAEPGAARAARLNVLLAAGTSHPRMTDHDGRWHVHHRDDGLPLAGVLHALIATGTAMHLAGRGMDRLGRCAVPECRRIYADVSRTGRRRYCSVRCANRAGVRRHRERADTTTVWDRSSGLPNR